MRQILPYGSNLRDQVSLICLFASCPYAETQFDREIYIPTEKGCSLPNDWLCADKSLVQIWVNGIIQCGSTSLLIFNLLSQTILLNNRIRRITQELLTGWVEWQHSRENCHRMCYGIAEAVFKKQEDILRKRKNWTILLYDSKYIYKNAILCNRDVVVSTNGDKTILQRGSFKEMGTTNKQSLERKTVRGATETASGQHFGLYEWMPENEHIFMVNFKRYLIQQRWKIVENHHLHYYKKE